MFRRGLLGYLPANIVQGLVGFGAIVVFTRLLTPTQFGQYALAFSVMTLTHTLVFTWIEAAMARFWAGESGSEGRAHHMATLWRALILTAAVYLPVAALVIWLAPLSSELKLAVAAGVLGAPARSAIRLAQERFRAEGAVGRSAGLDVFTTVAGFAIGAGLAVLGFGGGAPLAGAVLACLLALPLALREEAVHLAGGRFESARCRTYAGYGLPIAASLILTLVLTSTDRFLLAALMNERAVGAYHAGYSLANRTLDVMFLWLGAAGGPALVVALERQGVEGLRRAASAQASTFLMLALPAATGLALVADPLCRLMVGEGLSGPAAGVTPIIAASALLSGLTTYYFHQAFTLGRKTRLLLAAMAVPALANVGLNLMLIPRFGLAGAAWATLASFGLGLTASIVLGRRALVLPIPWLTLARAAVACGVMAATPRTVPTLPALPELATKATLGAVVYGLAAYLLDAAGIRGHGTRVLKGFRARFAT